MRCTVCPDQTAAVQGKQNRKILNGHVVNDLVKSSLRKSRIESANGFQSLGSEATCKCSSMLLGNRDVKEAARKLFSKSD